MLDGQTHGQTDEWTDRQTDRQTDMTKANSRLSQFYEQAEERSNFLLNCPIFSYSLIS